MASAEGMPGDSPRSEWSPKLCVAEGCESRYAPRGPAAATPTAKASVFRYWLIVSDCVWAALWVPRPWALTNTVAVLWYDGGWRIRKPAVPMTAATSGTVSKSLWPKTTSRIRLMAVTLGRALPDSNGNLEGE